MVRPVKSPAERRDTRIGIRLTPAERAELELHASAYGITAAEFLRDVRRRCPHVVVVVITSYGSIEGAVEATKIGAFDYLTKPIVDEEIRVVVEKAARQQSLLFENQALRSQLDLRFGLGNVVGHDHRMLKIFDLVSAVADSRTTVPAASNRLLRMAFPQLVALRFRDHSIQARHVV